MTERSEADLREANSLTQASDLQKSSQLGSLPVVSRGNSLIFFSHYKA